MFEVLYNQITTFCTCANGFEIFNLSSTREKLIWSSCLLLWKHLLILKISGRRSRISVQLFFALVNFRLCVSSIGRFCPVYNFQAHRRLPVSILRVKLPLQVSDEDYWKTCSKLVSIIEASKNFDFDFFSILKTIRHIQKVLILFVRGVSLLKTLCLLEIYVYCILILKDFRRLSFARKKTNERKLRQLCKPTPFSPLYFIWSVILPAYFFYRLLQF